MNQLETFEFPTASRIVLHCRPRFTFHLGHTKMLNVLHRLLSAGHKVTILIIPYDEHIKSNRTLRARLKEEIQLTRSFYSNYLGFPAPHLNIVSASDLDISLDLLSKINDIYVALYEKKEAKLVELVDRYDRSWASPNVTFVAKCIAAIESLSPNFLISSKKHGLISEGFGTLLAARKQGAVYLEFNDFMDLQYKAAMDSRDTVHTFIDINDNEGFALQKLAILDPGIRSRWLSHFIEEIVSAAPERLRDGIGRIFRVDGEREIALTRFVANVRKLIPYDMEDDVRDVKVSWASDLAFRYSEGEREEIERLARSIYGQLGVSHITCQRTFNEGQSGSLVMEVREHGDLEGHTLSNVSVLKIGPAEALQMEKTNYDELVSPTKTAAFMEVKAGSRIVGGRRGITYQGAEHFLGVPISKHLKKISDQFIGKASSGTLSEAEASLDTLFVDHLYRAMYSQGVHAKRWAIKQYLNEFLPSELKVFVDQFNVQENLVFAMRRGDVESQERLEVVITELSVRDRKARAYTVATHKKIDIGFDDKNELLLNALSVGSRLAVSGRVLETRDQFYTELLKDVGIVRREGAITLRDGGRILDPICLIDDLLSREFDDVVLSPVHGDLHSGNVLCADTGFGIIDYGKTRKKFLAMYDVAFLTADIQLAMAPHLEQNEMRKLYLQAAHTPRFWERWRGSGRLATLFQYASLPAEIKSLGSEELYNVVRALVFMGMMKFKLSPAKNEVALALAVIAIRGSRHQ